MKNLSENQINKEKLIVVKKDSTSMKMIGLAREYKNFTESYTLRASEISNRLKYLIKIFEPRGEVAENFLKGCQNEIETALSELLSKNSKYFWLHIESRIFPELPFWYIDENVVQKVQESRYRLRLAIMKYGLKDPKTKEFTLKNKSFFLKSLTKKKVKDIYSAEELCHLYTDINILIRLVNKTPSQLIVDSYNSIRVVHTDEVKKLIEIFDDRFFKEQNILSQMGGVSDISLIQEYEKAIGKSIILFRPNAEKSLKFEQLVPWDSFIPNYKLFFLDNRFHKKIQLNKAMQKKLEISYGFTFTEFVLVFSALSSLALKNFVAEINFTYQILQRGYVIESYLDYENFKNKISKELSHIYRKQYRESISEKRCLGIVNKVFSQIIWTNDDFEQISLKLLKPNKIIINTGYGYLIDLRMVEELIKEYLLLMGSYTDKSGEVKGKLFEKDVRKLLRERGYILWRDPDKKGKDDILKNEKGEERQMDFAVIQGEVLYVGECRAWYRSRELVDGDGKALDTRIRLIKKSLKEHGTRVDFVKKNRRILKVPKKITRFEPILITPYPEYIHRFGQKYWLNEICPRVLTPSEFISFLQGKYKV
jgi:hypothetical protein